MMHLWHTQFYDMKLAMNAAHESLPWYTRMMTALQVDNEVWLTYPAPFQHHHRLVHMQLDVLYMHATIHNSHLNTVFGVDLFKVHIQFMNS